MPFGKIFIQIFKIIILYPSDGIIISNPVLILETTSKISFHLINAGVVILYAILY